MKEILEIFKQSSNPEFIDGQFNNVHWNKNVLFIHPQLNGRHFYRYILPYVVMFEYNAWGTAITSMDKFKPNKEYEESQVPLTSKQILWADYIVFPFTTVNLMNAYKKLREINPDIRVIFNVDFNYYELSKNHPVYDKFSPKEVVSAIEDNIFYSDLTLVTNSKLSEVLVNKFTKELNETKYKNKKSSVEIGCFPMLIDDMLVTENIQEEIVELSDEEKKPLRIGIVGNNYIWEDINSYKSLLKEAKEKLGDKIKFFMIGYEGIDHKTQKSCLPVDFEFEYIKPCTIVHYFKQLRNLQLDLMFIPLRQNEFNTTSENYNKFLEAGMFNVPIMVYDIFPYNEIIKNGQSGILLTKKKEFVERLEHFEKNRDELKRMGNMAHDIIMDNFIYHTDNLPMIDQIYNMSSNENKQ
jgi:glycosyltransferase involved in cell wall biosynthesis